ncbi:hypothetical protein [Massilia forsythiae]|uniref:hypothetical protein n=1 Tax=Massilia forsythiae TaxID=2728020 RepID=UPI001E445C4B|nr:hypothetical protein [Massilia forsythiae]
MIPTDRLTMRSTTLESSENEKTAAAVMLTTPANPVASRMEMRIGSMESLLLFGARGAHTGAGVDAGRANRAL